MPSLEDQLTGFKRGLLPQIKSKLPVQEYALQEEMIDQAKLIEEDFIKSADEDTGFHLVKNALKYNPRVNYLVGIYEEQTTNKTKTTTINTVLEEKATNQKATIFTGIASLQKKSKQTEDTLTENFHRALAMNSFPFPNRGTIPSKEQQQTTGTETTK